MVHPEPKNLDASSIKGIVFRSVLEYLKRPGHVLLPGDMISDEEYEKERHNPLLRAQALWQYWHGSGTFSGGEGLIVSTVLKCLSLHE